MLIRSRVPFRAVPGPSLTVLRPGDTIYAYYTGSGFVLTNSLTGASLVSLPAGPIAVRFVDMTSGVVIAKEDLVKGPSTTLSATATTTTTATATVTATPTATKTATPTPVLLAANFNWVESGSSGNVRFTDTSTGGATSWSWNFGGGATSTKHPTHKFTKGASYDVVFTIRRSSDGATGWITKRVTV